MNKWIKENWKALAMISTLITAGVGGYTNLLLELGQLRAEVDYQTKLIDTLTGEYGKLYDICSVNPQDGL